MEDLITTVETLANVIAKLRHEKTQMAQAMHAKDQEIANLKSILAERSQREPDA